MNSLRFQSVKLGFKHVTNYHLGLRSVMFQDISEQFNKKNRPSFNRKSFDLPLLKVRVYNSTTLSQTSAQRCIKQFIRTNLKSYDGSEGKVYRVSDQSFKGCLINDAIAQFHKALYNWAIYKQLVSRGLWSWAFVTLYYSQFYSINALLNIQGNAFTRPILLNRKTNNEVQVLFHIYTEDFHYGRFIFEMRKHKPHDDVWQEYHYIYKNYRYKVKEFSDLYQFEQENERKFLDLRHEVNYDTSFLFNGFVEYLLTSDELDAFARNMQQDIFNAMIDKDSELELEYIATLRIKLLFDLLYEICDTSHLISLRQKLYADQVEMLNKIRDNTPVRDCFLNWVSEKAS